MEFMLTREQAWDIVCEFTKSEGLRKHALAVETCVVAYAKRLGEDEQKWSVTALLHDFDWEIHPQLPDHPMLGEPILAERGVDEEIRRRFFACRFQRRAACLSARKSALRVRRASRVYYRDLLCQTHAKRFEVDVASVKEEDEGQGIRAQRQPAGHHTGRAGVGRAAGRTRRILRQGDAGTG
jgi:hypothetical protein